MNFLFQATLCALGHLAAWEPLTVDIQSIGLTITFSFLIPAYSIKSKTSSVSGLKPSGRVGKTGHGAICLGEGSEPCLWKTPSTPLLFSFPENPYKILVLEQELERCDVWWLMAAITLAMLRESKIFVSKPKSVHVRFVSNNLVQMEILRSLRSAADWVLGKGTPPIRITKL